jgi:hypothetical protein
MTINQTDLIRGLVAEEDRLMNIASKLEYTDRDTFAAYVDASRVLSHEILNIWPTSPEAAALLLEYDDGENRETVIEYLRSLGPQPIETAPITRGEPLEPLLLWAGGEWVVGRWDGRGWYSSDRTGSLPLQPTHWTWCPSAPAGGSAAE